jgi:hypothetical protein
MAGFVYDSAIYEGLTGAIDFKADRFKVMLVDRTYVADKSQHSRRSDVTGEITGRGYVAGGVEVAVTADLVDGATVLSLGGTVLGRATLAAAGAVYYKSRGGLPSNDELVAYVGFDGAVIATNGDFTLDRSVARLRQP